MRILLVHDGHAYGGLERIIESTVERLGDAHEFGVLVRGPAARSPSAPQLVSRLDELGAVLLELPPGRTRTRRIVEFPALVRLMSRFSPDVVHIHTVKVESCQSVTVAARLAGVRSVVRTEHNSPSAFSRTDFGGRARRMTDALCSATITVSNNDRGEQVALVGRAPASVRIIRNGVDTERFAPAPVDRPTASSEVVVGTLGRLAPQKGLCHLVDAIALGGHELAPVRLRIAGDGPLRGELERQVERLGLGTRVEFVGTQSDPVTFLRGLDIGAMPSLHEGLSLTLLEMMAVGLPTVVSEHPGLTEAAVDGVTGYVVPIGDARALADAIGKLIAEPELRRSFGVAARQRAVDEFGSDRYFAELEALYVDTAAHGRLP